MFRGYRDSTGIKATQKREWGDLHHPYMSIRHPYIRILESVPPHCKVIKLIMVLCMWPHSRGDGPLTRLM